MKILLIYPEYEETFWNLKKVLKILGKSVAYPPLGLLTVAAMIPEKWEKRLIDLNCSKLKEKDISWADYVFVSAMVGQKKSAKDIIDTVKKMGKPVIAGGPLFTSNWEDFNQEDTFFLGEAEDTFPILLEDLKNNTLKKIYSNEKFPDLKKTPIPEWNLINPLHYNSMCLQLSRGCPYNCEFCEVPILNGRIPRIKTKDQMIAELESLYEIGWRAGVFIVDDNFIGNKGKIKKEYLPALIEWQKKRNYPFILSAQVSINLSDDSDLMKLMTEAGFATVFVGIETPDSDSLIECGKKQNINRDLIESVKRIQRMGMEVNAGFILGFDNDKPSIFQCQIEFIQKSGIVAAMVGLLNVPPKTRLYHRLKKANRLIEKTSGTSSGFNELNYIPVMDSGDLIEGYNRVISTIYSPQFFYKRIRTFLEEFRPKNLRTSRIHFYHIRALLGSIWFLGLIQDGRGYYWKLIFWSLFKNPGVLPYAVGLPLGLIHFRKLEWAKQYDSYFRES
jgi:radical SAM superfamily enzyme YgiQ (UPF0313 family)